MQPARTLRSLSSIVKAIIFDMDGVLVDSESQHFRAHKAAIEARGGSLTKAFYSSHGVSRDSLFFYADVFPEHARDVQFLEHCFQEKLQIYKRLQEKEGIMPVPSAIRLVKYLYAKKFLLAVGTVAHRDEAMNNLRVLGIDRYFLVVATREEGMKLKPAPDIYLKASKLLKTLPKKCLVIEDSESGVKAALAAGCECIAVPSEFTKNHDFNGAIVVSAFEEIQKIFEKRYK